MAVEIQSPQRVAQFVVKDAHVLVALLGTGDVLVGEGFEYRRGLVGVVQSGWVVVSHLAEMYHFDQGRSIFRALLAKAHFGHAHSHVVKGGSRGIVGCEVADVVGCFKLPFNVERVHAGSQCKVIGRRVVPMAQAVDLVLVVAVFCDFVFLAMPLCDAFWHVAPRVDHRVGCKEVAVEDVVANGPLVVVDVVEVDFGVVADHSLDEQRVVVRVVVQLLDGFVIVLFGDEVAFEQGVVFPLAVFQILLQLLPDFAFVVEVLLVLFLRFLERQDQSVGRVGVLPREHVEVHQLIAVFFHFRQVERL